MLHKGGQTSVAVCFCREWHFLQLRYVWVLSSPDRPMPQARHPQSPQTSKPVSRCHAACSTQSHLEPPQTLNLNRKPFKPLKTLKQPTCLAASMRIISSMS